MGELKEPTMITAIVGAIALALLQYEKILGWWRRRRDQKKNEAKAIQAVSKLELALDLKNLHIESLKELADGMESENTRLHAAIARQDERLVRKDARISHLETLLDGRGKALK